MPRASEPVALAPVGTYRDMHLAIVPGDHRGEDRLPRHALRLTVGVRNQTLTEALIRLAASGRIARQGDVWMLLPVPVPAHIHTARNGNGNDAVPEHL